MRDPSTVALNNALNEVMKAYPEVNHSFIFAKNETIISGDPEPNEETIKEIKQAFETLKEKAEVIGNLKSFQINGKDGKLILSNIQEIFLLLETSAKIEKTHIHTIIHVLIPTVLKTLETICPTPIQSTPQKELIVDTFSGFFARDSVQIDEETLMEWTKNSNPSARLKATITGEQNEEDLINQVQIETYKGNSALCKVKKISDVSRKGKNLIRIHQSLCKTLALKKGQIVKVKPAL